ncbi:MAG: nucleotide pyrophosphatase/phosphodiesterase family protein [Actinomycetota bacterium]
MHRRSSSTSRVRPLLVVAGAAALSFAFVGAPVVVAPVAAAPAPAHVVVLVVDGLNPPEVGATTPNMAALAESGTVYAESRSVLVAETIVNHVAMMTGGYPDRNGIPLNNFWDRSAASESVEASDPKFLTAETLFTSIRRQCPSLATAAVLSKTYLHGIFSGDADGDGKVDAGNLWEPSPIIPVSNHAPDVATAQAAVDALADKPSLLFINLGDVDRAGHIDATGATGVPVVRQAVTEDTDVQVGRIVQGLKDQGMWDSTVLVLLSDHGMDWGLPQDYVRLSSAFDADALLAGSYVIVQNGGSDSVYLKNQSDPAAAQRLKKMREIALATEGVDGAWYRLPNALDGGDANTFEGAHPAWHLNLERTGDLIAFSKQGWRFSDPSDSSNPLPGNHGHFLTRHSFFAISGGAPIVKKQTVAASQPSVVNPMDDTTKLPEQSETVDVAPTAAWLLGVSDPGTFAGKAAQYQGRVLTEAFSQRPAPACVHAASLPSAVGAVSSRLPATGGSAYAALALLALLGSAAIAGRRLTARV